MLGQMVNFNKSALYNSKGASKKIYNSLVSILGARKMVEDERYLCNLLPILRKMRSVTFDFIVTKVKSKIASWKATLLFLAGRNVLIKSVASTILMYKMSVL